MSSKTADLQARLEFCHPTVYFCDLGEELRVLVDGLTDLGDRVYEVVHAVQGALPFNAGDRGRSLVLVILEERVPDKEQRTEGGVEDGNRKGSKRR